ncbi:MAG: N-formylglutamate amidohydrolase [Pseudomonadota bacterium]
MQVADLPRLLSAADPEPVELVNPHSPSAVLLLCEHAGRAIPATLGNLGVSDDVLTSHRAWDIGAESVARALSDRLDAPLILQRYSRLVIDSNRRPGCAESIPSISDQVTVPANQNLSDHARQARADEIFWPLDAAIERGFETPRRACFSIHSFTPHMDGFERPWHAGFLTRTATETAHALMATIASAAPELNLELNQPYQVDNETDWFLPAHAEKRALPHCLFEIRNDQLADEQGVERWVDLLAGAITTYMATAS